MGRYILAVLLTCSTLFAQNRDLLFEKIEPEGGLSAPLVRGLCQDKEGFIWFGALNGIYRYDGYNLKPYGFGPEPEKTMTQGYANIIYDDSKNNFWIGTSSGLNKLDRKTGVFQHLIPAGHGNKLGAYVWSVFEDSKSILWVGAMGLYTVDRDSLKLNPVPLPKGMEFLNNLSFESIAEDKNSNLWFGTTIGLFKYRREANTLIPVYIDPRPEKITMKNWNTAPYSMPAFCKDDSGFLWAGTYSGKLLKVDTETGKMTDYLLWDSVYNVPCAIQSITIEDSNHLWVGTFSGLFLFEKSSGRILSHYRFDSNDLHGLSDEKLIYVMKDNSGSLWISTIGGGLNHANRTKYYFNKYIDKKWMSDRLTSLVPYIDFVAGRSGNLIVGTADGIDEINMQTNLVKKHLPLQGINVLMEDKKKNLWIGMRQQSGGGLIKQAPSGEMYTIKDSLGNIFANEVQGLFEASDGKIFAACMFYMFEIDPLKNICWKVFEYDFRLDSFGEDDDGNLLIGTLFGGLLVYDRQSNKLLKTFRNDPNDPVSIIDNIIIEIYRDSKNRIWLMTTNGFCRYNLEGKFREFQQSSGLKGTTAMCMVEDDSGRIWIGADQTINMFDPETGTIRSYDKSDGILEGFHFACGKADGILYFRTRGGITYFDPFAMKGNDFIPPVKITEMKVFDKPYEIDSSTTLHFDENYISFEFAALSFMNPANNLYAYKLEGVDRDWVYSGHRKYAAYTDLNPGDYIFRVKGSNNEGLWNEKGTEIHLSILPPWWETSWAYALYALSVLLLVYSWRKYDLKRQNLKYQVKIEHEQAEKQKEISTMKSRFFTNISHEFRTPLTLILGPLEKVASATGDPAIHKQTGIIRKNALHLLRLINQLLDLSRLDEKRLKLKVSCNDIVSYVKKIVMIFESLAESREIKLIVSTEKERIDLYFDKEKMENVLINLISNAFKFTEEGGTISAVISENENNAVIKIKDNGMGIPADQLPKLFDRFYQVDGSNTRQFGGTGIGLALTKELIELHHGKISVDSVEGEWTEFTIQLPLGNKFYREDEIEPALSDEELNVKEIKAIVYSDINIPVSGGAAPPPVIFQESDSEEKIILLLVEDNADVREYIRESIGDEFEVVEAADGEEGVSTALKIIPDLIVSDIMMPKTDGYELTRTLKTDEKTNHIPVILLTAKSDRSSKYEGLETGADDYLVKPFDTTELRLRIQNLINTRKKLQMKFGGGIQVTLDSTGKRLSSVNEKFMNKIREVITKHMSEEDFSIEEFGNEVAMSRAQLHRKLKAITGKSASRYLRSFRLAAARQMIEKQQGNISEIAYSVGFSSPIYFSKCFREEFGCSPSDLKIK